MEPKSSKAHKVANWKACKILCNQDDKCSYFIFKVNIKETVCEAQRQKKGFLYLSCSQLKLAYVLLLKADTYF